MDIRNSIAAAGAAAALLILAPAGAAEPPEPAAARYETREIAHGIWSFLPAESRSAIVSGNTTAIAGDDGVLVFDTGNFPTVAPRMLADIERLTRKPVRFVVNSHWHFDHANGNAAYRRAFPSAVFLSSEFTRERMIANFQKFDSGYPPLLEAEVRRIRGLLESGKRPDGSPLSEAARSAYRAILPDYEAAIGQYSRVELVPADITFDDSVTVELGRRQVRLLHLGRGNTAGDVIAYVPDARVVASGDILVLPVPYGFGSYPTEWAEVLRKLDALDAETIVPGHGPLQHDRTSLRRLRAMLDSLVSQVRPLVAQGLSLDQVRKKVNLDSFRNEISGGNSDREREFDQFFLEPIVGRAYEEANGHFSPEGVE
jgi:cyclase